MKEIFKLIKDKIDTHVKNGDMFALPSEVEKYVTSHEDIKPTGSILAGDFWRLEKGDEWLKLNTHPKTNVEHFKSILIEVV